MKKFIERYAPSQFGWPKVENIREAGSKTFVSRDQQELLKPVLQMLFNFSPVS
jgi:hypothetical protein